MLTQSNARWLRLNCLLFASLLVASCGGGPQSPSTQGPAPANLVISSNTVNFGNVAVGQKKSTKITVTNSSPAGSAQGTVTQLSASGTGFSASGPAVPFTLDPGQSASIVVVFAPKSATADSGQLSLTIQGVTQPETVALSGAGLAAGQLGATPSTMNFGTVAVGGSQTQAGVLTAGGADVVVSTATWSQGFTLSGITFPATIKAGSSAGFKVTFTPQSAGNASGQVSFAGNAANSPTLVSLAGSGSQLASANITANPSAVNFGSVAVGSRQSNKVTITNSAPAGSATGTVTQISSTGSGFTLSAPAVPFTLTPGQSASLTVTFAPASAASDSGQVSIVVQGVSQPEIVTLSGVGVVAAGQLAAIPSTMNFGTVTIGSTQAQNGSLSASGADVVISSAQMTGQDFSLGGISFPATIKAGTSIAFSVTFAPLSSGTLNGQVAFNSNAATSPTPVSFTGTGSQATQHSVTLSWNASTSQVVGYNVYRALQPAGPFGRINSSAITTLSYKDLTVQAGTTYYYYVTAVNASNVESLHSNVATAVVP